MDKKTVFISYSWDNSEHKDWVAKLAVQLEEDGLKVTLDQFDTEFGDELPLFMEKAVSENDFTLIICTPKYKSRSDNREGGVGYEGNIINGEIFRTRNQRKFIPVLRIGDADSAIPVALDGKKYVDLRNSEYFEDNYQSLINTLTGKNDLRSRLKSLEVRLFDKRKSKSEEYFLEKAIEAKKKIISEDFEPIKILEVISEKISIPKNDGTRGSGLYKVPFRLSNTPPQRWSEIFQYYWKHPPSFTNVHRPEIAYISGSEIVLDGTTIEEVERYHKKTLILVVQATNSQYQEEFNRQREIEEARRKFESEHKKKADEIANRIKFE